MAVWVPCLRTQAWTALHHGICSHLWWTNWQWVKITTPHSYPALVTLETLGTPVPTGWGPRRSTCLDLPRDLALGRLSSLHLLWNPPVCGSQEVSLPHPAKGPNSREANMPQPAQGFNLQKAVMPQPSWESAPWPRDDRLSGCNSTR